MSDLLFCFILMAAMIAQSSVAELRERTNLSNVHAVAFLRVCDGSVEHAIGLFEMDPNMMNDIGIVPG